MYDGTFYIFEDNRGEWRWRLRDRNNEIIGVSAEGFYSEWSCERAVNNVITTVRGSLNIVKV